MSRDHEKPQRCGWIALGLVALPLQGIIPVSLFGGVAGLKSAEAAFGQHMGPDLMGRLFVLGGMITGLMVSAAIIMTLTLVFSGRSTGFLKSSARAAPKEKFGLEE